MCFEHFQAAFIVTTYKSIQLLETVALFTLFAGESFYFQPK